VSDLGPGTEPVTGGQIENSNILLPIDPGGEADDLGEELAPKFTLQPDLCTGSVHRSFGAAVLFLARVWQQHPPPPTAVAGHTISDLARSGRGPPVELQPSRP
jgi:hypothetical protein